jgi:diaminohydroxyphosphoribosylaminopyrimidine deaminase/5-amino-6-(5-phosphoribosylamino)uracil reductase
MDQHQRFMSRALELAAKGKGLVSPNPMVGCVIVHQGKVIGEGYHHEYGGHHAEVVAVNSVKDKQILRESDVYVSLEPCAHHGKTPPCADMLASYQVKRVIVAQQDPNPLVNGGGIRRLKEAGVEVFPGVLEQESKQLNCRFNTYFEKKRPYIILKWAQTADGLVARTNYDSKWISGARSRQLVHRWRAEEDAILVGKNTAKYDNSSLTVRDWSGKNPTRVVIDHRQELDVGLNLFDNSVPTVRYHTEGNIRGEHEVQLDMLEFEKHLLDDLYHRKIQSLIIEGGAHTLQRFINQGLWDEARVFVSDKEFVEGIVAPNLKIEAVAERIIETDVLYYYENPEA